MLKSLKCKVEYDGKSETNPTEKMLPGNKAWKLKIIFI